MAAHAHAHDHFRERVLARRQPARVHLDQLDLLAQRRVRGLERGVERSVADRGGGTPCPVDLHLHRRRGKQLVPGNHLVAGETGVVHGLRDEGEKVVVVDELLAIGQLLHAGGEGFDLFRGGGEAQGEQA